MWFRESADQGHPGSKSFLGMMLVGGRGVEQDVKGGMDMLTETADAGYYEAQYYLGKIYYDGTAIPRNIPRAKKYLGLAAKQGDPDAAALLEKIRAEKI